MGDCTRSQVGALIVVNKRIVGLGYNGTRPGAPGCLDGACPRGRHYEDSGHRPGRHACVGQEPCEAHGGFEDHCHGGPSSCHEVCACGNAWPCPDSVAPGSSYDTGPGACIASHAEANAKADAQQRGAGRMAGGIAYISREPCEGCIRMYRNETDIEAMIWPSGVIALP
jgi:dCMP deaminase